MSGGWCLRAEISTVYQPFWISIQSTATFESAHQAKHRGNC